MKNRCLNIISILLTIILTACSATKNPMTSSAINQTTPINNPGTNTEGNTSVQNTNIGSASDVGIGGTSIGGTIELGMDEMDKSKMLHAMDKAPGKSTHWVNPNTDIAYSVTPTKKVQVEDKNYCRQYEMTASNPNGHEQKVEGIACIASDGNWHTLQA